MTEDKITTWLDEELGKHTTPAQYEELPSLKLQPNEVTELVIDFSRPFESWTGEQSGKTITKKIIPLSVNGVRKNWWINVKNPFYREILISGKNGVTTLKVLQTGKQAETKYVLVK